MKFLACVMLSLCLSFPTWAAEWQMDPKHSSIAFSGTHAGKSFTGHFKEFSANIQFDPAKLAGSYATVKVQLDSTATGDATYDKTLPQKDWFDIDLLPHALFKSTKFHHLGEEQYSIDGLLTIRGETKPVTLDAVIMIDEGRALVEAETVLNRMDYQIGATSDAQGQWVSLEIPLKISLAATKK